MAKLRILIVDDSAYNRQAISQVLGQNDEIEIVGKAFDGEEGLKLADALKPDLITLDLEMPRMDGFTFLRMLMARMPTPVLVISQHNRKQNVFRALELGALDFVAKPARYINPELESLTKELIEKVRLVRALQKFPPLRTNLAKHEVKPLDVETTKVSHGDDEESAQRQPTSLICIGSSTGGPRLLHALVKELQPQTEAAVLIAQHMPEKFTEAFAERLDRVSPLKVCEAQHNMAIVRGHIYVAPGGAIMEVFKKNGQLILGIRPPDEAVRYTPSVDQLFITAAESYGPLVLAVVLTGMGFDGSLGVKKVHECGGKVIAESQETAVIYGMPKEAIATGCVDEVLPIPAIIEKLAKIN